MTATSAIDILRPTVRDLPAPHQASYIHRPRSGDRLGHGLSDQQVASYREQGYLILRGVFSAQEMDRLRVLQEQVLRERPELLHPDNMRFEWTEYAGEPFPWKIDPFSDLHPELAAITRDRRICDKLCSLYDGYEPRLFKEKYIIKPPGSHGSGKHQDYNWWQGFPHSCVSVVVAIDAADRDNGCTQLWPGSHHHGFLHQAGTLDGVIPPDFTRDEPTYLETEPGDVALFSCFTIHAAGPNQSERFRRQLFLTYNDARHGEHYFEHREHFLNYRASKYSDRADQVYFV